MKMKEEKNQHLHNIVYCAVFWIQLSFQHNGIKWNNREKIFVELFIIFFVHSISVYIFVILHWIPYLLLLVDFFSFLYLFIFCIYCLCLFYWYSHCESIHSKAHRIHKAKLMYMEWMLVMEWCFWFIEHVKSN